MKLKPYRQYGGGAFLKKEDFPSPMVLTILDVTEQTVTAPGKKPEDRLVLHFNGTGKGLVLNRTNGDALFAMTGHEDPSEWIGTQIELYVDENVTYGGKRIGGVRLRKPTRDPF